MSRQFSWEWSQLQGIHQLVLKKNRKELDFKFFDSRDVSGSSMGQDRAEWAQWINNKVMTVLSRTRGGQRRQEEVQQCAHEVFVRTNRGVDDEVQPKSWLILAGHADPAIGLYRTDAPTTSHLAVLIATVVAVSYGWTGFFLFDVQTAFLGGLAMERGVGHTCTARRVCPGIGEHPPVQPLGFLQILKGAYGLTEAPRPVVTSRHEGSLQDIGGEELMMAKAAFVFLGCGTIGRFSQLSC